MLTSRVACCRSVWARRATTSSTSRVRISRSGGLLPSGTLVVRRVTISGPKRFEYDSSSKKWLEASEMDGVKNSRRVSDDINTLLAKEMKTLYGVDMKF